MPGKDSSVYPARLKELPGMPKQLYYIGSFPEDDKPTAAIVGARLCSPYGRIQAFRYGKFLSEHGVQVISGMAAGIDAEGHKGALEGGTPDLCRAWKWCGYLLSFIQQRYLPEDSAEKRRDHQRI